MKTEFSIYIFTFTTAFVFTFSLLSFSEYSYTEQGDIGPPDSGRVSHIKQLYNELEARGQGSDEPGEAEFQSQGNNTVEWDYGDVWNRIYSSSFPRYPFGYERIPDQYSDYLCYLPQGDYKGPIHEDNRYYFKYSDSEDEGEIQGCPTPEDEAEVNEIWEWEEDGEGNLGDYIARDTWSGLLWTAPLDCNVQGYDGGNDRWENSKNLCAGLGEEYTEPSGESGDDSDWEFEDRDYEWRLPTKNELMQISPALASDHGDYGDVGHSYGYNCNDDIQNCTGDVGYNEGPGSGHGMYDWNSDFAEGIIGYDRYWSQNLQADNESRAFLVRPFSGRVFSLLRTSTYYGFCVRCVAEDRK